MQAARVRPIRSKLLRKVASSCSLLMSARTYAIAAHLLEQRRMELRKSADPKHDVANMLVSA